MIPHTLLLPSFLPAVGHGSRREQAARGTAAFVARFGEEVRLQMSCVLDPFRRYTHTRRTPSLSFYHRRCCSRTRTARLEPEAAPESDRVRASAASSPLCTFAPTFTHHYLHSTTNPRPHPSLGLRTSLSVKYAQGDLSIIDSYNMDSIKTKNAKGITDNHGWQSALIVHGYAACRLLQATHAPALKLQPFQCGHCTTKFSSERTPLLSTAPTSQWRCFTLSATCPKYRLFTWTVSQCAIYKSA